MAKTPTSKKTSKPSPTPSTSNLPPETARLTAMLETKRAELETLKGQHAALLQEIQQISQTAQEKVAFNQSKFQALTGAIGALEAALAPVA